MRHLLLARGLWKYVDGTEVVAEDVNEAPQEDFLFKFSTPEVITCIYTRTLYVCLQACTHTLPRKLPQVAIGFQHGKNVIHHTVPTMFNELHNYTRNGTAQNSNHLTILGITRNSSNNHEQLEQGLDE